MLTHDDLRALQAVHDNPAVSILWSIPAAGEQSPFERLLAEAAQRLRLELPADKVRERVTEFRSLAAQVEEDRGQQAVALFASAWHRAASRLPEPVRDRVVIDDTFATRDLVRALHRSPDYLVLVLAEPFTRLFEGRGRILREMASGGFPLEVDQRPSSERGRRHDPSAVRDRHLERVGREVDRAPAMVEGGPAGRPVVVVGGEERLAKFVTRSRLGDRIIGRVAFNAGESMAPSFLCRLVWPEIEAWLSARRAEALAEVDVAAGRKRLAAGIDEIWPLALDGRGELLVVEEGYEYPARMTNGSQAIEPTDDRAEPGVLDDAIDEVIEHVLIRRGRAILVPDGTLAERDRVALTLRY